MFHYNSFVKLNSRSKFQLEMSSEIKICVCVCMHTHTHTHVLTQRERYCLVFILYLLSNKEEKSMYVD